MNATNSYHAQLTSVLTKFPVDVSLKFGLLWLPEMRYWLLIALYLIKMQLEILYAPVFSPSVVPVTMRSLMFERAAVVFNLGSLYSQLAASEDRSNVDGIKRAAAFFQVSTWYSHRSPPNLSAFCLLSLTTECLRSFFVSANIHSSPLLNPTRPRTPTSGSLSVIRPRDGIPQSSTSAGMFLAKS